MSIFDQFTDDEIKTAKADVDAMRQGMGAFSAEAIKHGDNFPEHLLLPPAEQLFANRFGIDPCSDVGSTITLEEAIQWATGIGAKIRDPLNRVIKDPYKVLEAVDKWREAENFQQQYGKPGDPNNQDLLSKAKKGHAWEETTGKTLNLKNYLYWQFEQKQEKEASRKEAVVPSELLTLKVSSFCAEGTTITNSASWDGTQIPGCRFKEELSPLAESDLACDIHGTNGRVVFHDGREECPQGMTKLPNNTGLSRGNTR